MSARMGVNAAETGEPVQIAAQMQFRQGNGTDGTDGDFQHTAVAAQIHQHFAVDLLRELHQNPQQILRQEQVAVKAGIVQRLQFPQVAIAYAFQISVDHISKNLSILK